MFRVNRVLLGLLGFISIALLCRKVVREGDGRKGKEEKMEKEAETGEERRNGVQSSNMEDEHQCYRVKTMCSTQNI